MGKGCVGKIVYGRNVLAGKRVDGIDNCLAELFLNRLGQLNSPRSDEASVSPHFQLNSVRYVVTVYTHASPANFRTPIS